MLVDALSACAPRANFASSFGEVLLCCSIALLMVICGMSMRCAVRMCDFEFKIPRSGGRRGRRLQLWADPLVGVVASRATVHLKRVEVARLEALPPVTPLEPITGEAIRRLASAVPAKAPARGVAGHPRTVVSAGGGGGRVA